MNVKTAASSRMLVLDARHSFRDQMQCLAIWYKEMRLNIVRYKSDEGITDYREKGVL